ncbi:hypothetical protein L107_13528 [Cyanobium sp. Copco_Reservoir_LC18]|nr:hypothetical protein L107_13528 [Cyanobium sp. Copco_Reservoir_LC18]
MIVDLCVVPIGVGVNLARYLAACERVLLDAGLKIQLHPNGTAIEGEWAPVFRAIEACHRAVHAMGCPRVCTTEKVNTRTDRDQTLEDKAASVAARLQQMPEGGGGAGRRGLAAIDGSANRGCHAEPLFLSGGGGIRLVATVCRPETP